MAIVTVAPSPLISSPPTGGPAETEIQSLVSNQLFTVVRVPLSVSALRFALLAELKAIVAAVETTPTATSCA
jgi:hypothetical protein